MGLLRIFTWVLQNNLHLFAFPGRSPVTLQTQSRATRFADQVPGYVCAFHIIMIYFFLLLNKIIWQVLEAGDTSPWGEFHAWVHFHVRECMLIQASAVSKRRWFPFFRPLSAPRYAVCSPTLTRQALKLSIFLKLLMEIFVLTQAVLQTPRGRQSSMRPVALPAMLLL